ncbi:MAG: FAD-binding oxidoreductase [Candidatus Methanoperedens sp.]|nr:FAD-binding oxidoreductase [Candidatus Methanoperedens sp.]
MSAPSQFLQVLSRELGSKVQSDAFTTYCYESDIGKSIRGAPIAVVFPETADDISVILKIANDYGIPVTVRGGGTTVGGETVARSSIIIDTKKLCRFISIDASGKSVYVEAGMTWIELYDILRKYHHTFKVAPSSVSCTIGGTISVGGFDPHSYIHGTCADQVEELEVVLPDGSIKTCNSKNNSEIFRNILYGNGMIGIITKVKMGIKDRHVTSYDSWFAYTSRKSALSDYFSACENGVSDGIMYLEVFNQPIVRIEQFEEPVDMGKIKGEHITTFTSDNFYVSHSRYMYAHRIRIRFFPFLWKYSPVSLNFIDTLYPEKNSIFEMFDYSDKLRSRVKSKGVKMMGNLKMCLALRVKEDSQTRPFSPIPSDTKKGDLIFGSYFGTELLSKNYNDYHRIFNHEMIPKVIEQGGTLYKYCGHVRPFAEKMFSGERWSYLQSIKKKYDSNNILNRGVLFERD